MLLMEIAVLLNLSSVILLPSSISPSPELPIHTRGGTSGRSTCKFPFRYKGQLHFGCIQEDSERLWCGTDSDLGQTEPRWGYCVYQGKEGVSLHWCHNDHGGVSNHQPHGCLLNRLFRRRSKKTSKLRVTGLCAGNALGQVNSPHKGPVTRKMFPFDDVIMYSIKQGPFRLWAQPMREGVTTSLIGWDHTENDSCTMSM